MRSLRLLLTMPHHAARGPCGEEALVRPVRSIQHFAYQIRPLPTCRVRAVRTRDAIQEMSSMRVSHRIPGEWGRKKVTIHTRGCANDSSLLVAPVLGGGHTTGACRLPRHGGIEHHAPRIGTQEAFLVDDGCALPPRRITPRWLLARSPSGCHARQEPSSPSPLALPSLLARPGLPSPLWRVRRLDARVAAGGGPVRVSA